MNPPICANCRKPCEKTPLVNFITPPGGWPKLRPPVYCSEACSGIGSATTDQEWLRNGAFPVEGPLEIVTLDNRKP